MNELELLRYRLIDQKLKAGEKVSKEDFVWYINMKSSISKRFRRANRGEAMNFPRGNTVLRGGDR